MRRYGSRTAVSTASLILILALCLEPSLGEGDGRKVNPKPNFLLFMVDDLGIGDVGCFGNTSIRTPNIDRIAKNGVKLTQHLAAAAVCTPSRAAFLTGRYPIRSGMAPSGQMRVVPFLASPGGLPANETTFATVLKQAGYDTALVGKWHLGVSCSNRNDFCHHPLNHGFDYFYGLPLGNVRDCGVNAGTVMRTKPTEQIISVVIAITVLILSVAFLKLYGVVYYNWRSYCNFVGLWVGLILLSFIFLRSFRTLNCVLMRNKDVVEQPFDLETLTPRFTEEAVAYLQEKKDVPFLLYVAYSKVHTALATTERFRGKSQHGSYGDNVEEMDWSVGEIMKTLDELGLTENTFVYLSSDNGGHIEEVSAQGEVHGGWNGIYKGGKAQGGMEGGIRVPTVLQWPGKLPAGSEISEPTSQMDVFSTVVELANQKAPQNRVIDGKNLWPLLTGKETASPHEFLFHYCGTWIHAARYRPRQGNSTWKVHFTTPNWTEGTMGCFDTLVCYCYEGFVTHHDPPLLYDIAHDPTEDNLIDVSSDEKYQHIVSIVKNAVEAHRRSVSPAPNQFAPSKMIFVPWLQHCCNLPYCSCQEETRGARS
ncbi:STS [Branchiostoma lanceolatum]|uniref:STS protein n=1 Tax=Branchiostoma lanceolatum TaxID=7740 RepID=A0A8J9Z4H3_BRALA|nr:STS [Branchiostoma lanceolatum]